MLKEIDESDTATFAFQAFDWLRRGKLQANGCEQRAAE